MGAARQVVVVMAEAVAAATAVFVLPQLLEPGRRPTLGEVLAALWHLAAIVLAAAAAAAVLAAVRVAAAARSAWRRPP